MENKSLLLDLVEWVAGQPRPYAEAMDAWRTSCPRFPIWEDALERRFIVCRHVSGGAMVEATPAGITFLRNEGRAVPAPAP